jgi:hypothetical protein
MKIGRKNPSTAAIHVDLFGPLKMSDSGKKFILCMTDALTKYVELVPLPNKEANTVANAFLTNGIVVLAPGLTSSLTKERNFAPDFPMNCSKGLALII